MNIKIRLNWNGPVNWSDLENNHLQDYLEEMQQPGVYCHCLGPYPENIYSPFYVGKADSIINRQWQHLNYLNNYSATLFNLPEAIDRLINPDIAFLPEYDLKPNDVIIRRNKALSAIFYATVSSGQDIEAIEGAIQIYLIKKSETRALLITKPSSYRLRNTTINNDYSRITSQGITLKGMPDMIITPSKD